MASYEQQADILSRLNAFRYRILTNFNKRDAVLHEIHRHNENQAAHIKFRKHVLETQTRENNTSLPSKNSNLTQKKPPYGRDN